ncbi:hypothetical protein [Sandaracinus amylolyticus]|uniref:hypothetical protein n=1 Tax=Sandaracinus amylolyticus TaxID=927083 RepID=UPI001F242DFB|nr:hypothetical protein [Sandaracinus amylolyticus]UJR78237.1 Hypothetical protein I5071_2640 [Sandaracinus amylolyticus]
MRLVGSLLVLVAATACGGASSRFSTAAPVDARPHAVPLALGEGADQLVFDVHANRAITSRDRTADIALVLQDELCDGREYPAQIEVTVELADGSTRTERIDHVTDCETVLANIESVELGECDDEGCRTSVRVGVRALSGTEDLDLSLYASVRFHDWSHERGGPHVDARLRRAAPSE